MFAAMSDTDSKLTDLEESVIVISDSTGRFTPTKNKQLESVIVISDASRPPKVFNPTKTYGDL